MNLVKVKLGSDRIACKADKFSRADLIGSRGTVFGAHVAPDERRTTTRSAQPASPLRAFGRKTDAGNHDRDGGPRPPVLFVPPARRPANSLRHLAPPVYLGEVNGACSSVAPPVCDRPRPQSGANSPRTDVDFKNVCWQLPEPCTLTAGGSITRFCPALFLRENLGAVAPSPAAFRLYLCHPGKFGYGPDRSQQKSLQNESLSPVSPAARASRSSSTSLRAGSGRSHVRMSAGHS